MVHVMHMLFMFFAVFKNLKSISEDNILVHALDVSMKCHQNSLNYPIKYKKWGSSFEVAPKLCIFLYNAGRVRQGRGMMHSDVMDTVFHSGDAWDSASMP